MGTYSRSALMTLMMVACSMTAAAKSPIYRCIKDGQMVLTDKPCDGTPDASPSKEPAVTSSGAVGKQVLGVESVVGEWRGQTQFQGAENAQLIEEAHTVVPLTVTFSADGKVSSTSTDNGCTLLGLWAPGSTPRLFTLDVTLKNCRYGGFNRRYTGNAIATFPENSAQFALQAYTLPSPGMPIRRYDVAATLRR